jgi:hypothetical protein
MAEEVSEDGLTDSPKRGKHCSDFVTYINYFALDFVTRVINFTYTLNKE